MVDIALFYGERGGGIRTYVDAKAAWARATGAIEHHAIVPARRASDVDGAAGAAGSGAALGAASRHELPSLRLATTNGYRVPLGTSALRATLRALSPDVVLLHGCGWSGADRSSCACGGWPIASNSPSASSGTRTSPIGRSSRARTPPRGSS